MVSKKKRRDENGGNGAEKENDEAKVAEYERSRQQRIKENLQRMHKLGIVELSRNLKPPPKPKTIRPHKPLPPSSGSPRRSSRLKSIPIVSYSHKRGPYSIDPTKDVKIDVKTCHQCRQKTRLLLTTCCKCNLGQFCGGCLLKRYGEDILEVTENPDWVCPVCRDICNCFHCNRIKGWGPIGNAYVKALCLGFESVADYLVHIRGPHGKQEDIDDETPSSCKEGKVSDDNLVSHQIDNKSNCKMDEDSNHVLTEKNTQHQQPKRDDDDDDDDDDYDYDLMMIRCK